MSTLFVFTDWKRGPDLAEVVVVVVVVVLLLLLLLRLTSDGRSVLSAGTTDVRRHKLTRSLNPTSRYGFEESKHIATGTRKVENGSATLGVNIRQRVTQLT